MKKLITNAIAACLLLSIPYVSSARQLSAKPLENVFTLELSFGDKDLPSEYLLVRANINPGNIDVNDAGDIYVFDEYKIKVYDKNGKPKAILGGKGQGPGKYSTFIIDLFNVSPTGWLTVADPYYYTIYSPTNKFINSVRYNSSPVFTRLKKEYNVGTMSKGRFKNIISLNDKELIITRNSVSRENYNESGEYYDYIFYVNENKASVVAKYRTCNLFLMKAGVQGKASYLYNEVGGLHCVVLPDMKILYTHTWIDEKVTNNIAELTFHVTSPGSNLKTEFSITYKPESIPISVIEGYSPAYREKVARQRIASQRSNESANLSDEEKRFFQKIMNTIIQRKYYPFFSEMQSDGDCIFLIITEQKNNIIVIKVIDSETGKEISNFIPPKKYMFSLIKTIIKNGYCYFLSERDGFPVVEKYRIDPKVYGK